MAFQAVTAFPTSIYPMGPGFFIFFQDLFPNDGGADFDPALEKQREFYRKKAERLLAKQRAKKLNEKKQLKKDLIGLEVKSLLADQQSQIRQKQETELELQQVSESLLKVEKDLAEISKKRAKIDLMARIMLDDDEVMTILYG